MRLFRKPKEEIKADIEKKTDEGAGVGVGGFIIDAPSFQGRLRDIPWFGALAFQHDTNDLMSIDYLDENGEELEVSAIRVNFIMSKEMKERKAKP